MPISWRQGVATHLPAHIIEIAGGRGITRPSLETGSGRAFEPALALYRRWKFTAGPPFASCQASDFNQFLHLALTENGVP